MGFVVTVHKLTRKFVDDSNSIDEQAQQIMYYTLAIGHHTGVIDCFDEVERIPLESYERMCAAVADERVRYKLEGVMRRTEIEMNKEYATSTALALGGALALRAGAEGEGTDMADPKGAAALSDEDAELMDRLRHHVEDVRDQPAVFMIFRKEADNAELSS